MDGAHCVSATTNTAMRPVVRRRRRRRVDLVASFDWCALWLLLWTTRLPSSTAFVPQWKTGNSVFLRTTQFYSSPPRNGSSKEKVENNERTMEKSPPVMNQRPSSTARAPSSSSSSSSSRGKKKPSMNGNSTLPVASKGRTSKDDKKYKKKTNAPTKEELMKAVGETLKKTRNQQQQKQTQQQPNLFNPFQAGQKLRQTIDTALSLPIPVDPQKSQYYLDDRLFVREPRTSLTPATMNSNDDFVPEILVVGATGRLGRLLVRQLLLYQPVARRPKVRVLVRDLYTRTLDILGTGVTYCQGDLRKVESLEDAVTDVDKLVFCARCDEEPELLNNLLQAYQNVRHADYGTSQAAKRSLFKFSRRDDFGLFAIEEDEAAVTIAEEPAVVDRGPTSSASTMAPEYNAADEEDDYYDPNDVYDDDAEDFYEDTYGDDAPEQDEIETRKNSVSIKTQSRWIRNPFGHGVFVGRLPTQTAQEGEAAILSSRLRSREDPEMGIALGPSFAGFICRVCSDGSTFEAFVRTGAYFTHGIEYTCEWVTTNKVLSSNASRNKFSTVRLPFSSFKPVQRQSHMASSTVIPPFRGLDVRHIGLRFRTARNAGREKRNPKTGIAWNRFYLAMSYIKVYRSQPEPEFVYISDARIPPAVAEAPSEGPWSAIPIALPEEAVSKTNGAVDRTSEETVSKHRGEELLKRSGLSYAIVRVGELNDSPAGGDLELTATPPHNVPGLSRADVARVCVQALLDPEALNKSFYLQNRRSALNEDLSVQFAALPADPVV